MNLRLKRLTLIISILMLSISCYHATVDTGARPSTVVVQEAFASSWIYGLVPPKTVETASRCPSGVAKVETQLSFVNQLVSFLTLGIYTPMEITVTCAEGAAAAGSADSTMIKVDDRSDDAVESAFATALRKIQEEYAPVYIDFR